MANLANLFKKASLTLVDGLLLLLCAASLTYFSLPLVHDLIVVATPHESGDIKIFSVLVLFIGVPLAICVIFFGSFAVGCLVLALLPGRGRLFTRAGMFLLLSPAAVQLFQAGPREFLRVGLYRLANPEHLEIEARNNQKMKLQRQLRASGVLSVEREADGVRVTNNTDQLVRVQVNFRDSSGKHYASCFAGRSTTFPPDPSDSEMNLSAKEVRLFPFSEAHTPDSLGSGHNCGFDGYAVWGWNENGGPVFLSERADVIEADVLKAQQ
jgi:hypothetical protein